MNDQLMRQAAAVDSAEALVFERVKAATVPTDSTAQALSMQELFPPHDFGTWPKGFAASREQMYGNHGR